MDENKHLEQFKGQSSILTSEYNYRRFFREQEQIGRKPDINDQQGSMFISTSSDIDKALKECNGNIEKLESCLGLQKGALGDGPLVRIDINTPENYGLRVSNGKESGSNEFWNTKLDVDGKLPTIFYTERYDANGNCFRCIDTSKTDPSELSKLHGQYWDEKGIYHPPNPDGYDGKTSGNLAEAVINQVPNRVENVSYTKIEGFKRGEESTLNFSKLTDGYSKIDALRNITSQNIASSTGGGTHAPPSNGHYSEFPCPKTEDLAKLPSDFAQTKFEVPDKGLASKEELAEKRKNDIQNATDTGASLHLSNKNGLNT